LSLDDWILALHLLAAFAMGGAMTVFSIGAVTMQASPRPSTLAMLAPLMRVGSIAVSIGAVGTIVFGVWLSLSLDTYEIWDAWILIAIALWAIGTETGRRSGQLFELAGRRSAELAAAGDDGPSAELAEQLRAPATLHWISTLMVVLVVADMVWKPWA
jgi:hypothetical protein